MLMSRQGSTKWTKASQPVSAILKRFSDLNSSSCPKKLSVITQRWSQQNATFEVCRDFLKEQQRILQCGLVCVRAECAGEASSGTRDGPPALPLVCLLNVSSQIQNTPPSFASTTISKKCTCSFANPKALPHKFGFSFFFFHRHFSHCERLGTATQETT